MGLMLEIDLLLHIAVLGYKAVKRIIPVARIPPRLPVFQPPYRRREIARARLEAIVEPWRREREERERRERENVKRKQKREERERTERVCREREKERESQRKAKTRGDNSVW